MFGGSPAARNRTRTTSPKLAAAVAAVTSPYMKLSSPRPSRRSHQANAAKHGHERHEHLAARGREQRARICDESAIVQPTLPRSR